MNARKELAITRCMLYGCTFEFDNYGHPEREAARKYWKCLGPWNEAIPGERGAWRQLGFGHTQAGAALDWLKRTGKEGDLNVKKFA